MVDSMKTHSDDAHGLSKELLSKVGTGEYTETTLKTDQRVFARITDGIYRLPGSALRELISNAYDADASRVVIETDAPKFDKITIRDDGLGMTPETLANVVHHIGGSLKRTYDGIESGVTSETDSSLSPKGRKLIGKIGIGLFSVAQLTRHFQIITKREGENVRWVADVVLETYSEDELAELKPKENRVFRSGTVQIRDIPATDTEAHGTDVILLDLKQSAKDILHSHERWIALELEDGEVEAPASPPSFHIGVLKPNTSEFIDEFSVLPWDKSTPAEDRMMCMCKKIADLTHERVPNPKIREEFDNYLQMIWDLALSAPIDYVDTHPFKLTGKSGLRFFKLSNLKKGQSTEIFLGDEETIQDNMAFLGNGLKGDTFKVVIDNIVLKRPIPFTNFPKTSHSIQTPLIFWGSFDDKFAGKPIEVTGGPLSFTAYLRWHSKVVPVEHRGVLIRVHGASGALFDESFMRYQISEQTRLRQITAEIYVNSGLDAALNIDRESFNFSHPHYQIITRWLHNALRQLATQHKKIGREIRKDINVEQFERSKQRLVNEVQMQWSKNKHSDTFSHPQNVEFADLSQEELFTKREQGNLVLDSNVIFSDVASARRDPRQQEEYEEKIRAVAQVLEAYDLLDKLPYERQQELLASIVRIFFVEAS